MGGAPQQSCKKTAKGLVSVTVNQPETAPNVAIHSDGRLEGDERFAIRVSRGAQVRLRIIGDYQHAYVTIEDATAPPPALQVRLSDSAIDVGDEATATFLAPGGGLTWGGFPVTFAMHPEVSPDPRLTGKAAADEDHFEIRVDGAKVDRGADGTWRAEFGRRNFDSAGPVTVSVFNREDRRAEGAKLLVLVPDAGGARLLRDGGTQFREWVLTRAAAPVAVVPRIDGIEVPADWALLPAGVGPGGGFRLLVVTSQSRTAEASGISSYDGHARSLAAAGHAAIREHGSKFRALVCTAAVDARDQTGTTGAGVPVYWLGGDKVADGYGDLYDGSWASNAPRDERGEAVPGRSVRVFTGCAGDGTGQDGLELGSAGRIAIGRAKVAGVELNDPGTTTERQLHRRIYALSPVFVRAGAAASAGTLSVADARAEEGTDATLDFVVTLDRSSTGTVTVDYATSDGSAAAGEDYTATSGTLTFAAGESAKTVAVAVLDDAHDEGSETLTLTLSNAAGATIADGSATGTITNSDPVPKAWLARFGRTVTGQVLDAVEARLSAPRAAGVEASLAGQALPSWRDGEAAALNEDADAARERREDAEARAGLAAVTAWLSQTGPDGRGAAGFGGHGDEDGREFETRALSGRDFVLGTSFALTGGSSEGGGFASLWGWGSIAGFDGREGSLTVDGEVTTGLIGADWASERWTAGLAVGHSTGAGGYRRGGDCAPNCGGAIDATLTGLYPYAGIDLTDRLSLWAAAGHGAGEVTVTPEAPEGGNGPGLSADLTMTMGAAGMRSEVLRPEGGDGLLLALKGDARFTRTSSEAVRSSSGNLAAADADAWLVRAGLEGSRPFPLGGDGATLTPSFELGIRRDGGDAETGLGADMGGGLAFADSRHGLVFEARARALVAHQAEGFREWGAGASFGWDPRPESGRGLSLTLTQSWGGTPSGGMDALLGRETLVGLAPAEGEDGSSGFHASRRLEGEIGYGWPAFGGAFTGTPNLGFGLSDGGARDWRIGWRLAPARASAGGFEVSLDATRSEPANDADPPVHGVMLRGAMRW